MPSLSIKNIPKEVLTRLRREAAKNRRSINQEAIVCLEKTLGHRPRRIDQDVFLARARELRQWTAGHPLREEEIRAAIQEGRP